jgi:hypothetical protein
MLREGARRKEQWQWQWQEEKFRVKSLELREFTIRPTKWRIYDKNIRPTRRRTCGESTNFKRG